MRLSISLEPECERPWAANYEGFSAPSYTTGAALLRGERILGHQARTYEHLMQEVAHDLPRSNVKGLPELIFSENIAITEYNTNNDLE
jgi:hypothetical protein